jgi:pimeloyl-ACP methyl ester carboxylesterase
MADPTVAPSVAVLAPAGETAAVVLVLPGGKVDSVERSRPTQLAALRMRPFATSLHRRGRSRGVAVWTVRYRYRGWNGAQRSPVADVEWALGEVRRRHGEVPVVLVGHSMGGRAALAAAGHPLVKGVCALAPWIERGDSVAPLAGRALLIVHGSVDRVTSPHASRRFAGQAEEVAASVAYVSLLGETHPMVLRWSTWHRLATDFVMGVLGGAGAIGR